ncbi:MAG: cytochrome c-type biogenesis protein CcmH [Sulfurifustaceae bacterium]
MRTFLLLFTLIVLPVFAADVREADLDRQVQTIAKDLRCTVCQNQSIAESEADLARDMRQIIREQLVAGKSRQEIVDYFVARYGDYVLMKPPARGPGLFIWIGPLAVLVVLATTAFVYLRRRTRVPPPPPPTLSPEDAARVRKIEQEMSQ